MESLFWTDFILTVETFVGIYYSKSNKKNNVYFAEFYFWECMALLNLVIIYFDELTILIYRSLKKI